MRVLSRAGLAVLAGCALALVAGAQAPAPALRQVAAVRLPGIHGRIDHFAADVTGGRLFMSALGNNTVEVFDLRTLRHLHTLRGIGEPQGVTYAGSSGLLFVASGDDGSVHIFDGKTYRPLRVVPLGSDADDTRYDRASRSVFVGFGDRGNAGLAQLNAATGKRMATIALPAHPEAFALGASSPRIFVNIPSAGNVVAVVDRRQGKVVALWRLRGARGNFPMAFDERDHLLFVVCRAPAEVLLLDTETGAIVDRIRCVERADDAWYDAARQRLYVSGGGGAITVIARQAPGAFHVLAEVPTAPGGRTSLFLPELSRLYLGIWGRNGEAEELRAYAVRP